MSKLFEGGVPTSPDVERLMKQIPAEAGTSATYSDIENILGVSRTENRFRSVTAAWRKRLFREKAIQTKAEGEALHFMTGEQALAQRISGMTRLGRAAGRQHLYSSAIDERTLETEHSKAKRNLLVRESQALLEQSRRSAKAIAGPAPVSTTNLRLAR